MEKKGMIYRFSEDAHISPVDDEHLLVVDDEVFLPERRAGRSYEELTDPSVWMNRVGEPGVNIMPDEDLWHHRWRYPSAPRPDGWDD
jgi:hypothetical protein